MKAHTWWGLKIAAFVVTGHHPPHHHLGQPSYRDWEAGNVSPICMSTEAISTGISRGDNHNISNTNTNTNPNPNNNSTAMKCEKNGIAMSPSKEGRLPTAPASSTPHRSSSSSSLSDVVPPLAPGHRRVYLIRHGETHWNVLGKIQGGGHDIPLNENGRLQAARAARELDGIDLRVIASSNLTRAKETADILFARHSGSGGSNSSCSSTSSDPDNITIELGTDDGPKSFRSGTPDIIRIVDAGFNEMSFGEFEGLAYRDEAADPAIVERFRTIGRQVKEDPTVAFPGGGECTQQVQERAMGALTRILDAVRADEDARHIAIVSHGRTNKVLIAVTALGDVRRIREVHQANTAINVLDVDMTTGKWTAQVINFVDHVEGHVIVR